MADDIVARLREGAEYEHDTVVMERAADEIERLRAEVDRRDDLIRGVIEAWDWWRVDTYDRCASVVGDAIRDARAALAGEKTND